MILAAISFADPLMLAGLAAALLPVILHLLSRMRSPVIPFPTLRFLKITAQKTARRRQIQQFLLLLVRVAVFALIAMAIAAPLIRGGSPGLAYGFVGMLIGATVLLVLGATFSSAALDRRSAGAPPSGAPVPARRERPSQAPWWAASGLAFLLALLLGGYSLYGLASERFFSGDRGEYSGRSTAMVILLDNSHSMLAAPAGNAGAPGASTRLAQVKAQVRELLGGALRPAEAAILPTNPGIAGAAPPPPMTTDMTRLLGYLDQVTPQAAAKPMQERIRAGLEMLANSQQAGKILVIASDFARPAFSDAELFGALRNLPWRRDLQVVLLQNGGPAADVGITSLALAEGSERPVIGGEATFEARFINNTDAAAVRDVSFQVDGKPVSLAAVAPRVQLGPAGSPSSHTTLKIPWRLTEAGPHRFTLKLENAQDALAWDDRRDLVLDVAQQVHVLVIGPEAPDARGMPRARSTAFYLQAALDPFAGMTGTTWSIKPRYAGADQVRDLAALQNAGPQVPAGTRNSAVFLCDLPKVTAAQADALLAYAKAGGRIVWVLGPSVDAAAYNQLLVPRELLPAALAPAHTTAMARPLDYVDVQSGLFMNLFDSQEPFRSVLVASRWTLAPGGKGRALAKLADESPIFVEHAPASAGTGHIYTLLTTPAATWSNLGASVIFVPLASRMALGDFAESRDAGGYETGRMVEVPVPEGAARTLTLDVTTPAGAVINVKPAAGNGANAHWYFDRTDGDGLYKWKSPDGRFSGEFAVNPPGQEADLYPAEVDALARESSPGVTAAGKATIVAASARDLLEQLQKRSEGTSLTPGFLAMVMMLAVIESLMANRARAT